MSTLSRIPRSLVRNVIQAVPTVFVIVTLGFFLIRLAPGDAADYLAAESGSATQDFLDEARKSYGLDLPILSQLLNYYSGIASLSLGMSPRYNTPVLELIAQRLPETLSLMATAILVAFTLGVLAGTIMALTAGRIPDRVLSVLSQFLYSMPSFWIGLMLVILFSVKLGWLPSGGSRTIGAPLAGTAWLLDRVRYIILPAASLALYYFAIYARLTRTAVLNTRSQDYVRTARAKGLQPWRIVVKHILRNALIPVTTMAGMHVAAMLGGAVVIETVFSWPGMGRLTYDAIMTREYVLLLGILLTASVVVIVVNALFDLLHALLDPRIEIR